MPRRPKGAKPSVTLDKIRRSVATSTASETEEYSEVIEARLRASRVSTEDGPVSKVSGNQGKPNLATNGLT